MTSRRNLVLILEDSPNRLELMRAAMKSRFTEIEVRSWDTVCAMRKEMATLLDQTCLISLDFDLSNGPTKNPGDGMDAVPMLIRRGPVCPVIVHSSLAEDGRTMVQALRAAGWQAEQIVFNRREAAADWLALVEDLAPHLGDNGQAGALR